MTRASLPPYFASVALATALICGAVVAQVVATRDRETVHIESTATDETAPQAGEAAQPEQPAPRQPQHQSIDFVHLSHTVEVHHTTLSRKEIRHRLRPFRATLEALEAEGVHVGVYLRDLDSVSAFDYAANSEFYPASSIKGPYVICVFEQLVDTGKVSADTVRNLSAPTIINSDNDTYRSLRDLCGNDVFAQWAVDCGAIEADSDALARYEAENYPVTTPRQLGKLWKRAYAYLSTPSDSSEFLLEQFEQRVESPIRQGLPDTYTTITKAGWFPIEEGDGYVATADAGIVRDGEHSYVLVVMTDLSGDLGRLAEIIPSIWSARDVLE